MSDSALHARATLDDLAKRRRHVTDAIVTLAAFYGLEAGQWLDGQPATSAPPAPVAKTKPPRDTTPVKAKGAKREPRPTRASSIAESILTTLKEQNRPMSPGELATATNSSVANLRYHVQALADAGKVRATGTTSTRRIALA